LAMAMILIAWLVSGVPARLKWGVAGAFLVAGAIGFGALYGERLSPGSTSVSARFDYWTAAIQGRRERPVLASGPGTFKRVYARVKRPESEMAQLTHNDYLQQACDSGLPGFLAYLGFVVGGLGYLYRKRDQFANNLERAVALGVAGWFLQGGVEF